MGSIIFAMLLVVVVGTFVIAAVAMGMRGKGKHQHPRMADSFARAAMALNGDGETPDVFDRLVRTAR
ncbi:hypothetical protein [Mariniluteicoccus flavus]